MLKLASFIGVLTLTASSLIGPTGVTGTAPVPRQSPELAFVDASGRPARLSSFKGRVVAIEFLLTTCPRCLSVAESMTKLHGELSSRGFQPILIALDNGIGGPAVTSFVNKWRLAGTAGFASSSDVDKYLGRSSTERFRVPQMVVIDRAGVIRAQSPGTGDPHLESESDLRSLIDKLLRQTPST